MKEMKRILALFLCLVTLAGVLPVSAFATEDLGGFSIPGGDEAASEDGSLDGFVIPDGKAEEEEAEQPDADDETTDVLAGSDFQASSYDAGATIVSGLLQQITDFSKEVTEASSEATEPSTEVTELEEIAVTGITLDKTALELGMGEQESVTLTATVLPEDATDKTVIWTSSDSGVARVDESGVVTLGWMGEAVITATAGDFSATCTITLGEGEWSGFASGKATYVLAGSDFQASSHDAGATIVSGLLEKIKVDYPAMNGFLFAGDYDVNYTDSATGKAKLQETVQAVYGAGMDEIYVQGNHDGDNLVVDSTLTASGANDAENYGVFVINEKDYMWRNDDAATIRKTAENLKTYLNAKRNADYTKPIFVMSHLPLHYCMRTREGGKDGMYAKHIFDVLNEAGNAGLNIIFMFGHNHSHGWDDYLGGAAIFLTKGDKINIAQNSTTVFKEETLAFTYMNAGYVGYYGTTYTSDVDKTLTMTTFAITDTDVTISRYDSNGTHDLKSAGVYNVEHPDSTYYSTDTTTVGTPYTLDLNTEITPAGEEVEVPGSGNTGSGTTTQRTYTRVTSTSELVSGGKYLIFYNGSHFMLPEVVEKSNDGGVRKGFNIESTSICGPDTISGDYSAKEWVLTSSDSGWLLGNGTQYAKLTNTSDYRITATLENSGDTFTIGGSENAFTFSNGTYVLNHNSRGLINGYESNAATFYIYRMTNEGSSGGSVDTTGGNWVTIRKPTTAGTRYVYELDTDGVDTGVEYLIVANGYPKALSAAASSNNAVNVTLDGNYAYAESDTYGWTFTRYNNGVYYNYIHLNGSTYLRVKDGALDSSDSTGSSRRWTVTSNNNGSYDIVRGDYNLRWSNSSGVFQASESNKGPVRLYKYVGSETTTAQAGLYGKISGDLTYNVLNGTRAEDALAAVKAGIDILYHNGDESAAQTLPDDSEGITWTLDPSYNGVVGGEYPVTIDYNGVTLGTAKVVVPAVNITGYSVEPAEGTVQKGASQVANTGALIYVQLENGNYYTVPVNVAMLTKNGKAVSTGETGTITGLTLTYNGVKITENFTLNVVAKAGNNHPEYPKEGAVKVSKTSTGIDFQSSGVARVEVSASGVPMKKGADVIVMLDLSSSMNTNVDGKTRLTVLKESLESLMNQLKANGDDGQPMDIRIAVADFHRYYTDPSSPYYINEKDHPAGGTIRGNNEGTNEVYTGSNALNAGAFVSVHDLADDEFSSLSTQSGTNYDYAFDAIYQLGEAINTQNAVDGTERDLFVIFMSDGAPFQYNYFSSQSDGNGADYWNNWLQGTMTDAMFAAGSNKNYYNKDGKHWMAEAIKGDPASTYPVIRKNNAADTDGDDWVNVNGLGAKMYSIGFCLSQDKDITVASMDKVIRNIATNEQYYFRADTAADLNNAFLAIGGDIAYAAYNARFVDQMGDNYNLQMSLRQYKSEGSTTEDAAISPAIEILAYDIYTKAEAEAGQIPTGKNIGDRKGTYTLKEVVKFSDDGTKAYSNLIDVDKDGIFGVTVNDDGTYTISDSDDNILDGGIIKATHFWYNSNPKAVTIDGVSIPTNKTAEGLTTGSTNLLPAETFYWKMGTVQTSEMAMRYYVYLTGSMEGTCEGGSYPTNEYATLYYDNYLHNPCYKDTVSPVMPWKEANVSYAFYLVNADGEIIVNQTTGETGTFANKVAVTNPVVYDTVRLNTDEEIDAVEAAKVLPVGYTLYDAIYEDGTIAKGSVYKVTVNSNDTGSWEITSAKNTDSTYVTQYDPDDSSASSKDKEVNNAGYDYTHTIVWFAVEWRIQALPDSVVVDYGLPVDIAVLKNDMFGEKGKLAGVGAYTEGLENTYAGNTMQPDFGDTYGPAQGAQYGTATANTNTGLVRYTLNTMQMGGYEKFAYAVNYTGSENPGYYYDTVTIIPATTIYYEDNFLDFAAYKYVVATNPSMEDGADYYLKNNYGTYVKAETIEEGVTYYKIEEAGGWAVEGTPIEGATQAEDRPGQYSLTDANNIYGYDSVNKSMSTFSLGSAKKVHVNADTYATASFTFTGTGFDVISMTSNTTGSIAVNVKNASNQDVANKFVNTYYGYTYNEETKTWVAAPDKANALYQVPVLQIENLDYGTYTVTITATYMSAMDKTTEDGYDLYLDAIRIYDPANDGAVGTDKVIEDAYKADGEGWPSYIELRNKLISSNTLGNAQTTTRITGAVFIDGDAEVGDADLAEYKSYGPNNEVYLASGQRVAFMLDTPANIANVHIGIKSANGAAGTYTITNIAKTTNSETGVKAGDFYGEKTYTVDTTTDMYYDLTGWKNDIIVISNTGDIHGTSGIISLTNIKSTYTSNPNGTESQSDGNENPTEPQSDGNENPTEPEPNANNRLADPNGETEIYMTPGATTLTLRSLNRGAEVPEEPVPDPSEPDESVPETTVPEDTEPSKPTEPEETEPEENKPNNGKDKIQKEIEKALKEAAKAAAKGLRKLLGKWF